MRSSDPAGARQPQRAEPVAALYEQGRVVHCGDFPDLAEELMALGSEEIRRSPDRADALVWALTELLLKTPGRPRVRVL
jgi:phage terminase large subunit-like protein